MLTATSSFYPLLSKPSSPRLLSTFPSYGKRQRARNPYDERTLAGTKSSVDPRKRTMYLKTSPSFIREEHMGDNRKYSDEIRHHCPGDVGDDPLPRIKEALAMGFLPLLAPSECV
ncbi:hypothetical protein NC653_032438 [Populus alba x Populus x berolinensis]|uniref:Uncharacterized protein n=1 Tax=Populus alba x Populus x berolinensis TaxID=444605 RepID=A0AAD6LRQ5_9ROSI|nr:hypothetical protein NC653_032438 [Populus alba x Populus x berolinensis]